MSPDHGTVDFLKVLRETDGTYALGISGHYIVSVKDIKVRSDEEDNFFIESLVNGVDVINVFGKIEKTRYLSWITFVEAVVPDSPEIL